MKIECVSCGATGLYKGFAEPEGTAVICNDCKGQGYREIRAVAHGVELFRGRKSNAKIRRVATDGGLWMLRTGNPSTISIEEFYEKVPED